MSARHDTANAELPRSVPGAGGELLVHRGIGGLLRNTFALAIGRNLNALGRLVVAGMIVRGLGAESFGIYSAIVALLGIADWVLDFGTTDVFVREVVKNRDRYDAIRRSLAALKLVQAPAAMLVMVALLLAMRYSEEVVLAGIVAAISIGLFAGVAVYRSIFKATLTMEREMLAEFASILALIPMVAVAIRLDLGVTGLMWAVFASRGVFLLGCIALARSARALSFSGVRPSEAVWLARSSLLIGTIGLLIVVNNSIEIILLSSLSGLADVAYFSAAQKLVWPVFMVLSALGTSYYPLLAAQYPKSRATFHRSCQQALNVTVIAGGLAVSGFYCGADFLVSLLGTDMLPAAAALRLLVVMCVVKSVAAAIGPTLYIVGAQRQAFRYFSVGLIAKVAAICSIAPVYGFLGTAYATLVAEALLITPLTLYFVRRLTGFVPDLACAGKVLAVAAASIAVSMLLLPRGSLQCALLAGAIYCALIVSLRVVDVRALARMGQR